MQDQSRHRIFKEGGVGTGSTEVGSGTYRGGQPRGFVLLRDRSSAPKRVPRRTPVSVERLIERLRRLRMTSTRIAAELQMAVSTVGAVLARLGLNRLSRLEPPEPPIVLLLLMVLNA